jgi:tellurite resistance protein TehA-like permease
LNWRRLTQFQNVPTSQASLALGVIGLGQAWALYVPSIGVDLQPFIAAFGAFLLGPVLIKYVMHRHLYFNDIRHPISGSLMAPISMAMLILCDYLALISPWIAYPLWMVAISIHLTNMLVFFALQLKSFKISNIVPSWFLYPVGMISSSLAGTQFGYNVFSVTLVEICITIYFFMLPVVLYRLMFEGMLPKRARPTLAIMAAPINLTLAAYLVNFNDPDPILTGALAGIAVTMTMFIYLCYFRLMRLRFQPSIAAVTFPSVISAIAMARLTDFFDNFHPHWHWLHKFGFVELVIATCMVVWVTFRYFTMYWPELKLSRFVNEKMSGH